MTSLGTVVAVALVAGCATGLGALPTIYADRVSHRVYDGAVGFAAGVMVGAAVFALLVPGLEFGTPLEVVAGLFLGTGFLLVANAALPHLHLRFRGERLEGTAILEGESSEESPPADDRRRALLVGSAVTIHNVPEGLAVGIAFASGETGLGIAIATAIAVQNVPDGFAMAVPAARAGVSNAKTVLYTTLSGGVPEPIAAAVGFVLVATVTGLFPVAAGFAAGAMIAVVFRELVPSSHGHGYADTATVTFVVGFALMLVVDTVLAV
ncbi:ZIP family metal transporter [Natrarchaeobaculum aegyptiacum]|uniref:ZIP family metal transporter n=1 Tax=Natrarchaeobaculum aegyptiacum TaxID=745377 RepID=A0A2Z2HVK9_9EURY|nr:ZIP family metal transporter [Natrarchaeobaculum aegyptiacum]ARS90215.1 ZIP family metal transporter [Natrarchaeobaculum aegyptiacum]